MEIIRSDSRLNLFQHFSGGWTNENNTTRALMAAFAHTPSGALLLRSFLDLVAEKIKGMKLDDIPVFSSPIEIKIGMQGAVSHIRPEGLRAGIVIELVPAKSDSHQSTQTEPTYEPSGITDATLQLSYDGSDSGDVMLVIESKLYGPAADEQLGRYLGQFKNNNVECERITIYWQDIYQLITRLPESSSTDPVISDFREFLGRRPDLVPFIGFQPSDLEEHGKHAIFGRLEQLCDQFVGEYSVLNKKFGLKIVSKEKKRGGDDYDFSCVADDGRILRGNLGVAWWEGAKLFTKLVMGAKTHWEVSYVKDRWLIDRPRAFDSLFQNKGVILDVHVRVRFHRFNEPWILLYNLHLDKNPEPSEMWKKLSSALDRIHRRDLTDDLLTYMESAVQVEDMRGSSTKETIKNIRVELAGSKARSYLVFVFYLPLDLKKLATSTKDKQIQEVNKGLKIFGDLLYEFSEPK